MIGKADYYPPEDTEELETVRKELLVLGVVPYHNNCSVLAWELFHDSAARLYLNYCKTSDGGIVGWWVHEAGMGKVIRGDGTLRGAMEGYYKWLNR